MGLKDTWVDKKDGVDINSADDINQVAHAVIELEKNGGGGGIAVEADPTVSDWAKQPNKPTYTASEVGAVSQTELEGAVDNALAQAKASGEFDGDDGYTPVKGKDYFDGEDGYTPVKGVDYWTEEDKAEIKEQTQNQIDEATEGISEQVNQNKADILKVSKRVAELEAATTHTKVLTVDDFEKGTLSSAEAKEMDKENRLRTDFLACTQSEPYSVVGNGVDTYRVFFFNNGTYLSASEFQTADRTNLTILCPSPSSITHIRIVLSYSDEAVITNVTDLVSRFKFSRTFIGADENTTIEDIPTKNKKLLIFGDSITETATVSDDGATYTEGTRSNWATYAKDKLQVAEMWNYAKSGAKWRDFETSEVRQKISHQIQTAIDNNRPADIIVISAGTNDNNSGVTDTYETAIKKEISELDRTIFSEAVRWGMYTLRNAYPDAICFVATPIQRAAREIDSSLIQAIVTMAKRYNFIVIPAHDESGIVRDFEVKSASGRDLSDGLHPNTNGQKKMSNLYCSYIMRYVTQ